MPANLLPLDECAEHLRILFATRGKLNLTLWREDAAIVARQKALTPDKGWPGTNDLARSAARDNAFLSDETLAGHIINRDDAKGKLVELEEEINGVEADRRAGEWRIRERMVEALTQGGVAPQSRGDRVEAAEDDATQAASDRALEDAFALHESELAAAAAGPASEDGVDIPF